mmetsp:Transcript_9942/g.41730  ORF Transcript_9942/g.41730 Transcript_9942/m.41730 type:complete len:581 (+) Transcript_9942:2473-4215(+)
MALLRELLHVLRRGAAGARLEQPATREQGHDGEHLCGRAQLDDREQVGEVIAEHVAGDAHGILPGARAGHGVLDRRDGGHDVHQLLAVRERRRERLGVVRGEVAANLLCQRRVVLARGVQPKHRRRLREARAGHGELHPVAHGGFLGLAHAPQVASLDFVLEDGDFRLDALGRVKEGLHDAIRGRAEGFVVAPVLLRLARHQPDVSDAAHGGHVERAVLLAVVDARLVHARVRAVGDQALDVLQRAVRVPHLPALADHRRHGRVDDHVRGDVEVGDPAIRVHHRDARAVGPRVAGVDVRENLRAQRRVGDFAHRLQDRAQAVLGVGAGGGERSFVPLERVAEVHRHDASEEHGVAHLHHGRLEVQRDHQVVRSRVSELALDERVEVREGHARGVHRLQRLHGNLLLERRRRSAARGVQLDAQKTRGAHHGGLLRAVEVPGGHGRDSRLGVGRPSAHLVRVRARVRLDGRSDAAVRVAFAQHRVHRRPQHLGVPRLGLLFLDRKRVRIALGERRHVEALGVELRDDRLELRHRRRDVGKFHDVRAGRLGDVAERRQRIRPPLRRREPVRERGEHAAGEGDV